MTVERKSEPQDRQENANELGEDEPGDLQADMETIAEAYVEERDVVDVPGERLKGVPPASAV